MQDPNTPNPSDEENGSTHAGGSGGSEEERPKLKLKKILTPLSPHLKAPREERDPHRQNPKSFHPSPQAEPVEPEEPVLERPRAEPLPLYEIEPPRPEELNPHLPEAGIESGAGEWGEGAPEEPSPEEEREAAEAEEEEEAEEPAAPPRRGPSPRRRGLQFALGVILLAAAAFLALRVFSPFGGSSETVPMKNAATDRSRTAATGGTGTPYGDLEPIDLLVQMESETAEEYINRLQKEPIFPAREPRGIFIDRVFFPEGSSLNPKLGIRLTGIEFSGRETTITLQDSESNPYTIAVNR